MKRFLTDSYRRAVDSRISKLVVQHKVTRMRSGSVTSTLRSGNGEPHELSIEDAKIVYRRKCEGLEIAPNEIAEQRFIEQFLQAIKNKVLKFTGLGLGPVGMGALMKRIADQKRFCVLDLSMNKFADAGAVHVANYIAKDPPIIHLDLRSNLIYAEGFAKLFEALKRNFHIVSLDCSAIDGIERNKMGTNGCRVLAELLAENETLSHLNVAMSGISPDGCTCLGEAMKSNESLMVLDVSGNRFGTVGCNNMFQWEGSFGKLEALYLMRNDITDGAAALLCKHLENTPTLKILDLSDNSLTKVFLRQLVKTLQTKAFLESLSLAKNKLDVHCDDLLQLLVRNVHSLKNLNLSENPLKDSALRPIAEALVFNENIVSIDLSDTLMRDASAVEFAEVIMRNKCLRQLYLNSNKITDASSVDIAKALSKNNTLTTLGLRNNEMRDDTAQAMMEALQQNNTILDIDVDLNDFSYRYHAQLTQTISDHKKDLTINFAHIANQHIVHLKEDEQKLFSVRDEIQKQTEAVESSMLEKQTKERLFEELKASREREIAEANEKLEQMKARYDEISEQRRQQLIEFNQVKFDTERAQSEANREYQQFVTKRQHAEARLKRAESKKLDAEVQSTRTIDDLKMHLMTVKEELRQLIDQAHIAQNLIFKRDATAKAEAEQKAAEEKALAAMAKEAAKAPKKVEFFTLAERRQASRPNSSRMKSPNSGRKKSPNSGRKKSPARPKSRKSPKPKIITPEFEGEPAKQ